MSAPNCADGSVPRDENIICPGVPSGLSGACSAIAEKPEAVFD